MRRLNRPPTITITNRDSLPGGTSLSMPGEVAGEVWLVPPTFDAVITGGDLPYLIRLGVRIDVARSLAEVARLEIVALKDGAPVHAGGLRSVPLAALLKSVVREAAVFMTWDTDFEAYVPTTPAKRPRSRTVAGATDQRARSKTRKNAPRPSDVEDVATFVADLKRRGVRDWMRLTQDTFDIERATVYRRIRAANKIKPPPKQKRGK